MKHSFVIFLFLFIFCGCTLDYFGFSGGGKGEGSSQSFSHTPNVGMVYCNRFSINDFRGMITAYYDKEQKSFNTNKAQLFLWKTPYEFVYPKTNYIQVHSFTTSQNVKTFKPTPVRMEIINKSALSRYTYATVIGHELIEQSKNESLDEFVKQYSFVLEDLKGWEGITLSVFDVRDRPVKTASILIPPFPANPQTYLGTYAGEQSLLELHPFHNLLHSPKVSDRTFYEKGKAWCQSQSVEFEVPSLPDYLLNDTSVDSLLEELASDL